VFDSTWISAWGVSWVVDRRKFWVCGCGFWRGFVAVDSGVGCWVIDRRCGLCWVLVCVVVGSCCREVWLGKPGKKKKNIFYNILI
jgi:hypothetical protein